MKQEHGRLSRAEEKWGSAEETTSRQHVVTHRIVTFTSGFFSTLLSFWLLLLLLHRPKYFTIRGPRRQSDKSPVVIILSRVFCPSERRVPTHCRVRQRNNCRDPVPFLQQIFPPTFSNCSTVSGPLFSPQQLLKLRKKKYKFICRRVLDVAWWEKAIDKQAGIS